MGLRDGWDRKLYMGGLIGGLLGGLLCVCEREGGKEREVNGI